MDIVVLGFTGDIVSKKALPALFHLSAEKDIKIYGLSRHRRDPGFVRDAVGEHRGHCGCDLDVEEFISRVELVQGDATSTRTFRKLSGLDGPLIYAALPPSVFPGFLRALSRSPLDGPATKILIEKPVGLDLKSFLGIKREVERLGSRCLFVDHYLFKPVLRKGAAMFSGEPASIHVRLFESGGIGWRRFYDSVGALRDMGQNHALEMLAIVLSRGGRSARRAGVLGTLRPTGSFRYQHPQYLKDIGHPSSTETFFRLSLDSSAFPGVPITVEAGKYTGVDEKFISVQTDGGEFRVSLAPEPGVMVNGSVPRFERLGSSGLQYFEEYYLMFREAISGRVGFFTSLDEVESEWRIVQPVLDAWAVPARKELGLVGLGKMGGAMALRLAERGWRVVGYSRHPRNLPIVRARSLRDLVSRLERPRKVWLMVPHQAVEEVFAGLLELLDRGDYIIDGGNSFYRDSLRRRRLASRKGIHFVDVGVSGGPGGARNGACLMVGGTRKEFEQLHPLLDELALPGGYAHFGSPGAGHFVKMVHNGIEYGMMQAIAEGFNVLREFDHDLREAARVYNRGSVIESRLMGWLQRAFSLHGEGLRGVSGRVGHTGEAEWTVETARSRGLNVPVIEDSVAYRKSSRPRDFVGKVLSALREQFGGHSPK